jgi:hypothetical protein
MAKLTALVASGASAKSIDATIAAAYAKEGDATATARY